MSFKSVAEFLDPTKGHHPTTAERDLIEKTKPAVGCAIPRTTHPHRMLHASNPRHAGNQLPFQTPVREITHLLAVGFGCGNAAGRHGVRSEPGMVIGPRLGGRRWASSGRIAVECGTGVVAQLTHEA